MISAIEEKLVGSVGVLTRTWWPMRLGPLEDAVRLQCYLHGAMIFASAFSDEEAELKILYEICLTYVQEAFERELS